MKKTFLYLLVALLVLICALSLTACNFGFGDFTPPDYNADLEAVTPDSVTDENFTLEEDKTYYTSESLSLWMEVNGAFLEMPYFTLEGNKRIYDNLYFYERDYFYMMGEGYNDWYAALGDDADAEYAEVEKEDGYDIQINVKKAGIYKLVFDVDTLKFDMEYKAEIETPVYYTIPHCHIYTAATEWVEMSVNPENGDEFVVRNFSVAPGDAINFFDRTHTSWYKVTLDSACKDTYASGEGKLVSANVGGAYDIYINRKTYVVRFVHKNIEAASYTCIHYDGSDFVTLQPEEEDVPYVFRCRITADRSYRSIPSFYAASYHAYALTVLPSALLTSSEDYHYLKEPGTYDLIINLRDFTLSVERLPE